MNVQGLDVRYAPGGGAGIAGDRIWAVIEGTAGDPMSLACLEAIRADADAEGLLEILLAQGLRATPDFVICENVNVDSWRLLLRGSGRAEIGTGEGGRVVACHGVIADEAFDNAEWVSIGVGTDTIETTVPASPGIVPTRGIRIAVSREMVPAMRSEAVGPERARHVSQPLVSPTGPERRYTGGDVPGVVQGPRPSPAGPSPWADLAQPDPPDDPTTEAHLSADSASGALRSTYDGLFSPDSGPGGHGPGVEETAPSPVVEPLPEVDDLPAWGPSGPDSASAVHGAADPPTGAHNSADPVPEPGPESLPPELSPRPPELESAAPTESPASNGTFIDAVPGFALDGAGGMPPTLSAPPAGPQAELGQVATFVATSGTRGAAAPAEEEMGRTVCRGNLQGAQDGSATPMVQATRCPSGHLSPAFATTCRVCGRVVPPQEPVEVPRPPLGRLAIATGDAVTLDRDVVLGRNPSVPEGYRSPAPQLVRLNDPRQEVSGQHALVSLDAWLVTLTDLGSTNGTEIVTPDGRRQRLVPDSAVVIEPGTTIVLAEIVSVRFEVTA